MDRVSLYHKNHIFKQSQHPSQNQIFRSNDSRFQSFGRPVLGTSRPMCTIVHSFVLAVDRHTCQSTAIVRSSYGPYRSTRQSTDSWTPTLGRNRVDRPTQLESTDLGEIWSLACNGRPNGRLSW